MHQLDEKVSFEKFDEEIRKLHELLDELGIVVESESDLKEQTNKAFATLYYSLFSNERPPMSDSDQIKLGAAMAGLGDLAAKINHARTTPGFMKLRPHLTNMIKGSLRMNEKSRERDAVANKNSELYVGCLALGAGLDIELEDPNKGAGGKNPDILLKFEEDDWSIAVKTSHSKTPQTIFDNIRTGASQVERSNRTGVVFFNVKNIINHEALAAESPFASIDDATKAATAEVDRIINDVRTSIAKEDWEEVFAGKRACPLIAFMGQMMVAANLEGVGPLFVPVKVMRVLCVPLAAQDSGRNDMAWRLLQTLNHELQRNSGSTAPIGG